MQEGIQGQMRTWWWGSTSLDLRICKPDSFGRTRSTEPCTMRGERTLIGEIATMDNNCRCRTGFLWSAASRFTHGGAVAVAVAVVYLVKCKISLRT